MKKVFSVLLSLVMLMSLLSVGVAVSAATPDSQVVEAYAGQSIKIKFTEDNCYGVSGAIEYSNRNLFASLTPGGSTSYGKITDKAFILSSFDKVTCEVILTVKIADDAKVGDTCVVSFTDCELVENNEDFSGRSGYTKTVTVKIVKKPTTTQSTTKKPTTTGTKAPVANLDYTELNTQIGISEALVESEYTADSWAQMVSAQKAAIKARNAKTQNEINKAADALRDAIAALVKIDNSALAQLIADVKGYLEGNELADVWTELYEALSEAEIALESGDQEAINAAYTRLSDAFAALKDELANLGEEKVVVQEVEVPCTEKCHIWKNTIWHPLLIILLIVSALLNVVLAVIIISYMNKRKKNATDTTPVVDYDIADDGM